VDRYDLLNAVIAEINALSSLNTLFFIAQSIDKNILKRYNKNNI